MRSIFLLFVLSLLQDLKHRLKFHSVKVKLSLCFNLASRHEGVLEEWRYSSTYY
jgi:hypothetical protein